MKSITVFSEIFQLLITLIIDIERAHLVLFFQNALIVLLEVYLKDQFLKNEMGIGLMFYPQNETMYESSTYFY